MQYERLDGERIFVVRGFLTAEECGSLVARSEQAGYTEATITTAAGFVMAKDIRDNARLIVDDASLAHEWWQRAACSSQNVLTNGTPSASTSGFDFTDTIRSRNSPRTSTATFVEILANRVS